MATLPELERALVNADRAGDTDAARKLAAVINQARQDPVSSIPGTQIEGTQPVEPEPTVGEQVVGAGEAALTIGTGATGGTAGMVGGTLKAIAEEILSGDFGTPEAATRIEEEALRGAETLTYVPRTPAGREIVGEVGEALAPLTSIPPLTAELGVMGAGARTIAPAARAVTRKITPPITDLTKRVVERVREPTRPTAGTGTAAGAQAVDRATIRQAQAAELPEPIQFTKGQASREFEQQRFERETAKLPEVGEPIRERFAQQNLQLQQNMDAFIDMTGAEASDLRGVGLIVDKALRDRRDKDKSKIRVLYKDAEKAGELEEPVELGRLVNFLNESQSAESTAPILKVAKKELVRLGGATEDEAGNLIVKTSDGFRQRRGTKRNIPPIDIDSKTPLRLIESRDDSIKRVIESHRKWLNDEEGGVKADLHDVDLSSALLINADLRNSNLRGADLRNSNLRGANLEGADLEGADLEGAMLMDTNLRRTSFDGANLRRASFDGANFNGVKIKSNIATGVTQLPVELSSGGMSLNNTEQLRKFINKAVGIDPTNIKFAVDIKKAIDESTEGMGGNKYQLARRARAKFAQNYENIGVVKQLLNAKRGSDDRAIALEDVLRRSVLAPSTSLDTMRQIRRLLQTGGENGKQAWKELQGGTLRHIRDEALKSVSTDQGGNRVFSPSQLDRVITQLDKTGKLDYIFGKKGAEQLRVINDVAKDVMTSPPGVVNASNTASVLAGLVDIAISGTAGVPAPIMSSFRMLTSSIKDAKLKARVKRALGE